MESPNTEALSQYFLDLGVSQDEAVRLFRNFNSYSVAFRMASDKIEDLSR
jgi:hypothetical protein